MKAIHAIAFILLIVGGLNWGLVGLGGFFGSNWNLVAWIFGFSSAVLWIVYILVGVSAVYLVVTHKKDCKCCDAKADAPAPAQPMM